MDGGHCTDELGTSMGFDYARDVHPYDSDCFCNWSQLDHLFDTELCLPDVSPAQLILSQGTVGIRLNYSTEIYRGTVGIKTNFQVSI